MLQAGYTMGAEQANGLRGDDMSISVKYADLMDGLTPGCWIC